MGLFDSIFNQSSDRNDAVLDEAVAQLRASEPPSALSPATRAAIVESISGGALAPLETGLHAATRRALMIGAVPALLVAALLIVGDRGGNRDDARFVGVDKRGGEVIFRFQDGPGPHRVLASTDAGSFAGARQVEVAGKQQSFRVDATREPDLVFYKID